MCGLAGIYRPDGAPVAADDIRTMLNRIAYRGPDGSGVHQGEGIGLGHVRLSIQDLSDLAAQPMISHCGRYVLVYNGEIYNHAEMRRDLEAKDVELRSTGDTEALLEYLAAFGVQETLNKVEGMFAFALWDAKLRELTLARDRHGIKPLVYSIGRRGEVTFASEMKAMFERTHEPNLTTLNAILCGLGGTWGEATVFRGIRWVPAGEWMVFRGSGEPERRSFFHVNDFIDPTLYRELDRMSTEEIVRYVTSDMEQSINQRLISDAPVAAFVSGGVDSSLIAAMAAERHPGLKLFHANVVGDSELPAAEALANSLGLELFSAEVTDRDVIDETPRSTYFYEMPIGYHNGGCVPFLKVSDLAGERGIKVVLTGEGSDEYFYGYPHLAIRPTHRLYERTMKRLQSAMHRIPGLGALLWPREEDNVANHLRDLMFRYELQERRGRADQDFSFISDPKERDLFTQCPDLVIGNVRTLLHRNDRLGMSAGLESRFPFLGHKLARTAMNLPIRHRLKRTRQFGDWRHPFTVDKWIVREMATRHMPQSLSGRKKFGLRSTFYERCSVNREFFKGGFLSQYYEIDKRALDHLCETATDYWMAQIFSLEVWGQLFCLGMTIDQSREHMQQHVSLRADT